jgi:hypothetical protein
MLEHMLKHMLKLYLRIRIRICTPDLDLSPIRDMLGRHSQSLLTSTKRKPSTRFGSYIQTRKGKTQLDEHGRRDDRQPIWPPRFVPLW